MASPGVYILLLEYRPCDRGYWNVLEWLQKPEPSFLLAGTDLSLRDDGYPARLNINQVAQLLTAAWNIQC